jgi:hypothetical protein
VRVEATGDDYRVTAPGSAPPASAARPAECGIGRTGIGEAGIGEVVAAARRKRN